MTDLKRAARKSNAVLTDDPEGLLATLQITKRLITEGRAQGENYSIYTAMNTAVGMAAPKDEARTWWKAMRVIIRNTESGKSSLAILADAIQGQGRVNALITKRIPA
jgi:hypothetical protein